MAIDACYACMQALSHRVQCSRWQSSSSCGSALGHLQFCAPPALETHKGPDNASMWQCTMARRPPASTSSFARECVSCVSAALVALCVHADFEKDAPHLLVAQHAQSAPTAVNNLYLKEWCIGVANCSACRRCRGCSLQRHLFIPGEAQIEDVVHWFGVWRLLPHQADGLPAAQQAAHDV